jgi:hypothetical protein
VADAEQPGPERSVALVLLKRGKRRGERRLQRILGVLIVAQHRTAVAIQRLVVALVQDREGALAARRNELRKALVGQPSECERQSPRRRGRLRGCDHPFTV